MRVPDSKLTYSTCEWLTIYRLYLLACFWLCTDLFHLRMSDRRQTYFTGLCLAIRGFIPLSRDQFTYWLILLARVWLHADAFYFLVSDYIRSHFTRECLITVDHQSKINSRQNWQACNIIVKNHPILVCMCNIIIIFEKFKLSKINETRYSRLIVWCSY